MIDPFLSKAWADRHGTLSDFLADLVRQTRAVFEHLAAHAYDAPWTREAPSVEQQCLVGRDPSKLD